MALRRAASGASQERAKRPSRHACMLLRVPPKLNPCTTGEQAKARTRWRCRPAHDAPQGAWARPKSSTAPRQRQRGLLRERGGRLARPQRQQHQRDRHRQLRDHRQPVAPRAQRALHPQPAPLLRVQRRALRAARAGPMLGPGVRRCWLSQKPVPKTGAPDMHASAHMPPMKPQRSRKMSSLCSTFPHHHVACLCIHHTLRAAAIARRPSCCLQNPRRQGDSTAFLHQPLLAAGARSGT